MVELSISAKTLLIFLHIWTIFSKANSSSVAFDCFPQFSCSFILERIVSFSLTSNPRLKQTEIPERLSRSKSGKGLKNINKIQACLSLHAGFTCVCRMTKFPPVQELFSSKICFFFNFVRKWGGFDIHFRKSGGAREKTNFFKRFIAY